MELDSKKTEEIMVRKERSTTREKREKEVAQVVRRLVEFVAFKGETINQLTIAFDVSQSYFTAAKKGKSIIGADVIIAILDHYRDLSPDWLLFGMGSKLRGGVTEEKKVKAITTGKTKLEKDVENAKQTTMALQKQLIVIEKSLDKLAKFQSNSKVKHS